MCASDEYLVLAHRQWSQAPPKVKTASPVAFGPFPTPALTAAMRYGELSAHQTRPEPSAGFGFRLGRQLKLCSFFGHPPLFPFDVNESVLFTLLLYYVLYYIDIVVIIIYAYLFYILLFIYIYIFLLLLCTFGAKTRKLSGKCP